MQVYIHTSSQCQATEVSQLPERGAGGLWPHLHSNTYVQEYRNIHGQNQ